MSKDLSILRPNPPKYKINQTVYSRISATKGYIEPLYVHNVEFDPSNNQWLYSFRRDLNIAGNIINKYNLSSNDIQFSPTVKLLPVRLHESQIITFCEAIGIQINVLQKEYDDAIKTFDKCQGSSPIEIEKTPRVYEDSKFQTSLPKPKFGYNETAYILDTAQVVGRLEPVRISDIQWDDVRKQWVYIIKYEPRPERSMTIGDNDNWSRPYVVGYSEDELIRFCEAQNEVVKFLSNALSIAKRRRTSLCGESSESSG